MSSSKGLENNVFVKRKYKDEPIPTFNETKGKLPSPTYEENTGLVDMYWKTWEMGFENMHKPKEGSPFVSNYQDAAFSDSLFLWDTAFITMFANYGHNQVPGIRSLDNFYCSQHSDGEIVREINSQTAIPHKASEAGTPDSLNHPVLAWAELESYHVTGDKKRLEEVYPVLCKQLESYEKIKDEKSGLYVASWATMDNSPRFDFDRGGACEVKSQTGEDCATHDIHLLGVDTSSEVSMLNRDLAKMASHLGKLEDAQKYQKQAKELDKIINDKLWNEKEGFYYDLTKDGKKVIDCQTAASFWPILSHTADDKQVSRLVEHLKDEKKFNRKTGVPTVAADDKSFNPDGGYWRGGVWAPINTMLIRGLERRGYPELAKEIAKKHLKAVQESFNETGTVWEFYAPDSSKAGVEIMEDGTVHHTRPDFVGWAGVAPVMYFIEHEMGIKVNAPENKLQWNVESDKKIGMENLQFGERTVSLMCHEADKQGNRVMEVHTDKPFKMTVTMDGKKREIDVPANKKMKYNFGKDTEQPMATLIKKKAMSR